MISNILIAGRSNEIIIEDIVQTRVRSPFKRSCLELENWFFFFFFFFFFFKKISNEREGFRDSDEMGFAKMFQRDLRVK